MSVILASRMRQVSHRVSGGPCSAGRFERASLAPGCAASASPSAVQTATLLRTRPEQKQQRQQRGLAWPIGPRPAKQKRNELPSRREPHPIRSRVHHCPLRLAISHPLSRGGCAWLSCGTRRASTLSHAHERSRAPAIARRYPFLSQRSKSQLGQPLPHLIGRHPCSPLFSLYMYVAVIGGL